MPPRAEAAMQRGLFVALATAVLLWPLVYNRFPIVYGDSLLYSLTAFTGRSMAFRPSCYPYLIKLIGVFQTVQPVCVVQALLVAVGLEISLRRGAELSWGIAAAVVGGLAVFTTLPWWVSSLMPDVFFGLAVLAAGTLAFGRGLGVGDRVALWILLGVSVVEHVAMPPPLLVLAVLLVIVEFWRRRRAPVTALGILAVAVAGFLSYPLLNAVTGNGFEPSDGTAKYIFCRMAGDGLVDATDMARFTSGAPERQADLMARFDAVMALPANVPLGYLSAEAARNGAFSHDARSPFVDWTTDRRLPGFGQMIWRIVKRKPLKNVEAVIAGTGRLLESGGIPEFAETMHPSPPLPILAHDVNGYASSRQNIGEGSGGMHLAAWNLVIVPVYWLATAVSVAVVVLGLWRRAAWKRMGTQMAAFILAFDVVHAAVVFGLSGDFPRYQSRMSWVVVLGAVLGVMGVVGMWRAGRGGRDAC